MAEKSIGRVSTQTKLLKSGIPVENTKHKILQVVKVLQDWNVIIVFIENYRLQELDKAL